MGTTQIIEQGVRVTNDRATLNNRR